MKKLVIILGGLLMGGTVFGAVANPKQERNAVWLQESTGYVSHIYSAVEANFTDNAIPDGATVPAVRSAAKSAGVNLSFTFDDEASFTENWVAMTSDADGTTWTWQSASWNTPPASDGNTGYVGTGNNITTDFPRDYLFTRQPLNMSAGRATFSFDWFSMGWSSTDDARLKVFYSKKVSMEVADLTEIVIVDCNEYEAWVNKQVEFEIPSDGDYYFCIYYEMKSEWNDQELVFIDNVEILQEAVGAEDRLDLVLSELVLPASSLTLGNTEEIGVKVTNRGTVEITKMTLTYTLNDGTPVEQTFEVALAANASTTLTFTQKADFSAAGAYVVAVAVKSVEAATEAEENPEGNSLSGHVKHLAPQTLPYSCTFETAEEFAEQWKTVNQSEATASDWAWFDKIEHWQTPTTSFGDGIGGFVASKNSSAVNGRTANYLITAVPFVLPAERPISIGFQYRRAYGSSPVGNLQVYYGREPEVGENQDGLTLLGMVSVPATGTDWHEGGLEFEVAEEGEYYLFFKHDAEKTNGSYLVLDDLKIAAGAFVGTPDLAVSRVELPLSSCGLGSAEPIGVQVENRGTATITKFKLAYTVNGGTAVEQEFAQVLAPEAKTMLVFDTKANFSTKERYTVNVTASVLESDGKDEEKTDNNAASASVAYREPAVLPFEADFTKNAEEREKMAFAPGTWNYEAPRRGMTTATAAVLQTPCLPFEAEATYRVYLTYRGGTADAKVKFDLICGLASVPRDEWRSIKHFEINTSGEYETDVVEIGNGPIPGDYAVAIVPQDYDGGLYIQSVKVDRRPAYDIRIMAIRSTIGSQVPVQHAAAPEFEVLVKNFGEKNGTDVTVVVKDGETVIGKSVSMNLPVGDSAYCMFSGDLTLSATGDVALTVEAVLDGTAENQPENRRTWTFAATDGDYAFDNVRLTEYPTHVGIRNIPVGHIFTLMEQDTLTAVTLGWADMTDNMDGITEAFDVSVEVHPLDVRNNAGECLLAYEVERPLAGGVKTMEIPARVLPAGRYFIGVRQINPRGSMSLGCDGDQSGVFYLLDKGVAEMQDLFGYAAVRATFGHAEYVVGRDIELLSLRKPSVRGAYAANEPVVADYRNNGCEALEVEFKCTVSGNTQTKTMTVPAYGMGSVEFEADLSRPGTYGILVEAVASGDENSGNNSVRKTVTCIAVDPYVMDFEHCDDFAIADLLPWRTEDGDETRTTGMDGYKWPHYGEPMGFMAFNPAEVSMSAITPVQEGEKFGLAICAIGKRNDDWLISPKLKMPAKDASMSYYVRSYHEAYKETYEILVSTTDDNRESFVPVGEVCTATDTWTKNEVDLSVYNDQEIYIAFRYTAQDQFFFMIDDIRVAKPTEGTEGLRDLSAYVKSYPNPVSEIWTVETYGLAINHVEICNLMGEVVYRSPVSLDADTYRVNMGGFTPGMYTARVYTNAGVQVIKVIVRY